MGIFKLFSINRPREVTNGSPETVEESEYLINVSNVVWII